MVHDLLPNFQVGYQGFLGLQFYKNRNLDAHTDEILRKCIISSLIFFTSNVKSEAREYGEINVILTEFNYDEALALDLPQLNNIIVRCH